MRIHGQGLLRADPKEFCIEIRSVVHEPASPHIGLTVRIGTRVVKSVDIPAAIFWPVRHQITAL